MQPRLALVGRVALLLGAVCYQVSAALAEEALEDVARHAFRESQKQSREMSAPNKAAPTEPAVTRHPSFWQCSDGKTTLRVDLRGNACYARVRGWSPEVPSGGKVSRGLANHSVDDSALVQKTRELATPWLSSDEFRSAKPAVKREILLLAQLPEGKITTIPGRTIIRLVGPDDIGSGSFQAVFDPQGTLLRIDIAFVNARTKDLCNRSLLVQHRSRKSGCERAAFDARLLF